MAMMSGREALRQLVALSASDVEAARQVRFETFIEKFRQVRRVRRQQPLAEPVPESTLLETLESIGKVEARHQPLAEREAPERHQALANAFEMRYAAVARRKAVDLGALVDLAIDGLGVGRSPEVRHFLREVDAKQLPVLATGPDELRQQMYLCFLLLARRGSPADIHDALERISRLRELTPSVTDATLSQEARAIGCYYLLASIELVAQYSLNLDLRIGGGKASALGVLNEVERLGSLGLEHLKRGNTTTEEVYRAKRILDVLAERVDSSFFSVALPNRVSEFRRRLANRSQRAVLELWPSQSEALRKNLLDPTRTGVVVSMPTSSGKTLLAELAIEQALGDAPTSRIIYLAPTRALVNQVAQTLRRDLGVVVRTASPAYELDAVEALVLSQHFEVLVTTPEKLDLLIREKHPSVDDVSLVVVDEAHNVADEERGSRFELLLATLRNERQCRFVLLTPFARNASQLASWLDRSGGAPIVIDWKPNQRVVSFVESVGPISGAELRVTSLDSVHSDCPPGVSQALAPERQLRLTSKEKVAIDAVRAFSKGPAKGILLLVESPAKAAERAREIAKDLPPRASTERVELVCKYLNTEVGTLHPLCELLRKGVAFHHGGLTAEARYLVERLIEGGEVSIVCATTTLAQGVHFPLSVAVLESHYHFDPRTRKKTEMSPQEFWNIAGRVGRALEDEIGLISFATVSESQRAKVQAFLARDAGLVVSSLAEVVRALAGREVTFSRQLVEKYPPLSGFLQYVVHAVATLGPEQSRQRIEGLIRGSFVYRQLQDEDQELATELIRWARSYLEELLEAKRAVMNWWPTAADKTGLSSPSLDVIFRELRHLSEQESWKSENLIPTDGAPSQVLAEAIRVLAQVPEIHLGTYWQGGFDPVRVARIISAWVNGADIRTIAESEYQGDILECTKHLNSAVSTIMPWGLRAIERMLLTTSRDVDWNAIDRVPAMIAHGVRTDEAIALRMTGVPRFAAEALGRAAREENIGPQQVDAWLSSLPPTKWGQGIPQGSALSGSDLSKLWRLFDGRIDWREL